MAVLPEGQQGGKRLSAFAKQTDLIERGTERHEGNAENMTGFRVLEHVRLNPIVFAMCDGIGYYVGSNDYCALFGNSL